MLKLAAPPQTIESVLSGFLPRYAKRFPNVRVKLTEALGMDQVPLLERGEVHVGIRHDQGVNPWFESFALPSDDVLAACRPSLQLGRDGMIDIASLASHPLLLLDSGYSVRRLFNAACRFADVEPDILLESRAPHTLLALAEAGQGVAIIPSVLRTDRYRLKIAESPTGESRCATVMSSSGTSGAPCRAMRRTFAPRSPRICAKSCRLRGRRKVAAKHAVCFWHITSIRGLTAGPYRSVTGPSAKAAAAEA